MTRDLFTKNQPHVVPTRQGSAAYEIPKSSLNHIKIVILGRFTPNVSMGMGRFGIGSPAIGNASEDEGDVSDDDGDGDGDMNDDIVELSDEEGDYYDENGRNVSQEDDADDWEDLEF